MEAGASIIQVRSQHTHLIREPRSLRQNHHPFMCFGCPLPSTFDYRKKWFSGNIIAQVRCIFTLRSIIPLKKGRCVVIGIRSRYHLVASIFAVERHETVLNFVKPVTHQQMKSFLGSCNYFRDHVARYSEISEPLITMTTPYVPSRKLEWTEGRSAACEALKEAAHSCQKLYFLDTSKGGIHVKTDTSDYGKGGFT